MPNLRSVTSGFWIGVGSRDEPQELSGISHFIEHLLFKGTSLRSAKRIAEEFDAMGGELNAFSAKEYTCYYAKVLDEKVEEAFEVMTDMLLRSLMRPKDVDAERQVILEEIAMHEDSPDDIIHDLFVSALWESHPLGQSVSATRTSPHPGQRGVTSYFNRFYRGQHGGGRWRQHRADRVVIWSTVMDSDAAEARKAQCGPEIRPTPRL